MAQAFGVITYKGVNYVSESSLCSAYGIDKFMVKRLEKKLNIAWLDCFKILEEYLSKLEGNRPRIVSKIPIAIYNGKWYALEKELCSDCNVVQSKFNNFRKFIKTSGILKDLETYSDSFKHIGYCHDTAYEFEKHLESLINM